MTTLQRLDSGRSRFHRAYLVVRVLIPCRPASPGTPADHCLWCLPQAGRCLRRRALRGPGARMEVRDMRTIEAAPTRRNRPLLGLRLRPGRLALAVFRLPLVLYRHGWGWLLGTTFMLLVHAGRRTGQPHLMTAMVMRWTPPPVRWSSSPGGVRTPTGCGTSASALRSAWRSVGSPTRRNTGSSPRTRASLSPVTSCVRHPYRVRVATRILHWPDLRSRDRAPRVRPHPPVRGAPACEHSRSFGASVRTNSST